MAPKLPPPPSSENEDLESVEEEEVMNEEAPHGNKEEEELVPDSHLLKSPDDPPLVNKPKRAEDSKKQGQRVFSDEIEVVILKGMEELISKYGKDFMADFNQLYEYVKTGLYVDVSTSQLMTKIENLKKKYGKNDEKVKNGEELKPHDQTLYDLSKNIWGDWDGKTVSDVVSDVMVEKKKKEELQASVMDEVELDDDSLQFLFKVAGFRFDEDLVRRGVGLIGKTKRDDLVKKWKNLLVNESMLNLRRLELIRKHEQLTLNALLAYFNDA